VSKNSAPGNIVGGITKVEEKSLGVVQKGRRARLSDVRRHGERLRKDGLDATAEALLDRICAIASGEETAAERNGEREIAIWKRGVTL
jgi:altronate dehydratase